MRSEEELYLEIVNDRFKEWLESGTVRHVSGFEASKKMDHQMSVIITPLRWAPSR